MSELEETPERIECINNASPAALDGLWVVCCIANPVGYKSRYDLYRKFVRHVLDDLAGNLVVVKCAYGDQEHALGLGGESLDPDADAAAAAEGRLLHVSLRADSVLWHKENLLNAGIRELKRLRPDARLVVWADADVTFVKGRSALADVAHALARHKVVQCFSTCLDTGPKGEVLKLDHGYVFSAKHNLPLRSVKDHTTWHTGYVWAARLDFLDAVGGLFDRAILGSGDRLMADALCENLASYETTAATRGDHRAVLEWGRKARAALGPGADAIRAVGYVPVVISHGFHGFKKDRGYGTRGKVLADNTFDASADLVVNADGLYEWAPGRAGSALVADVLAYFHSRNEDKR